MDNNNILSEYLRFRKIWFFTPSIQIVIIILCFVTVAIIGKLDLLKTGSLFGRPNSFYLETLFAPIYEEIIFRGVIFGLLLNRYSLIKSLILTSLLFGLWHMKNIYFIDIEQLIKQLVYTTIFFGPLMCLLTYKTKTIWIATIVHYLNNTITFILIHYNHLNFK